MEHLIKDKSLEEDGNHCTICIKDNYILTSFLLVEQKDNVKILSLIFKISIYKKNIE